MFPGVYDQKALATIQAVFDDIRYQSDHADSVLADAVPMRAASLARAVLNAADDGFNNATELKAQTFARLARPTGAIVIPIGRLDARRSRSRILLAPWSAKDEAISFKPPKNGFRPRLV